MNKKTRTENVAGGAVKLAPSILAADFNRLGEHVAEEGSRDSDRIHVETDGHFVPQHLRHTDHGV
jgi:pentose-5-phosphate-3-epimerase